MAVSSTDELGVHLIEEVGQLVEFALPVTDQPANVGATGDDGAVKAQVVRLGTVEAQAGKVSGGSSGYKAPYILAPRRASIRTSSWSNAARAPAGPPIASTRATSKGSSLVTFGRATELTVVRALVTHRAASVPMAQRSRKLSTIWRSQPFCAAEHKA